MKTRQDGHFDIYSKRVYLTFQAQKATELNSDCMLSEGQLSVRTLRVCGSLAQFIALLIT